MNSSEMAPPVAILYASRDLASFQNEATALLSSFGLFTRKLAFCTTLKVFTKFDKYSVPIAAAWNCEDFVARGYCAEMDGCP
jgi:hypothetical protein